MSTLLRVVQNQGEYLGRNTNDYFYTIQPQLSGSTLLEVYRYGLLACTDIRY